MMTSLTRQYKVYAGVVRSALSCSARRPLTSNIRIRSYAQLATAPSFTSSSPAAPSSSSLTTGPSSSAAVSRTATLPNSKLWRFRPTHRRFPLSNRHNPATPLRFQPLTPPSPPQPHHADSHTSPSTTAVRVPFTISRTRSHGLPVYLDYRGGGTLVTTCVRRVEGDVGAMARQLQVMVGERTRVVVRPGRVEVKGNYVDETKKWLETIGF